MNIFKCFSNISIVISSMLNIKIYACVRVYTYMYNHHKQKLFEALNNF